MLISLSYLLAMGKIQKNIQTKVRPVGLMVYLTQGFFFLNLSNAF